jgi:hypothetical protein
MQTIEVKQLLIKWYVERNVSDITWRTWTEVIWEQGAENTQTEGGNNRRLEKIV